MTGKPAGISCGSQGSASLAKGINVTLKATPAEGFIFKAMLRLIYSYEKC